MMINEIKEISRTYSKEVPRQVKAFENANKEVAGSRHITTINEGLAGKMHPVTGVPYRSRIIMLNGERVEGVFPRFDSSFDCKLPRSKWLASDNEQFSYCTQALAKRIENDPTFASKFTPRQIEQIKNGEPRISGLTWHHNEVQGKMQLVDADTHARTSHTGGKHLWGGAR